MGDGGTQDTCKIKGRRKWKSDGGGDEGTRGVFDLAGMTVIMGELGRVRSFCSGIFLEDSDTAIMRCVRVSYFAAAAVFDVLNILSDLLNRL